MIENGKSPFVTYQFVCRDASGAIKWEETVNNVVTTEGKDFLLDSFLKGSNYTAAFYLGLASAGSKAATDSLATHAAWTELTPYAGNRPAIAWGTSTLNGTDGINTATGVVFTANAGATVTGAFICNVASGTSGKLYSVSDLTAPKTLLSGDTLTVTPTIRMQ